MTTVTAVVTSVVGAGLLSPALADTPQQWEKVPPVSALDFLMVLVLIPLGCAAVIAVLALLPSLAKHKGYEPGQAWRGESEWFGGPTKGLDAADEVPAATIEASSKESGGTSAQW